MIETVDMMGLGQGSTMHLDSKRLLRGLDFEYSAKASNVDTNSQLLRVTIARNLW